ncbi:MAG: hypothetical protein IKN15_02610 [Bacteroidaceae bacterium]|nr:hypothetical protein [Bacteroidaceae bacterium]
MYTILDENQRQTICGKIEAMFSTPSAVDGTCGLFSMPEPLIKDRAAYFNECIKSVYQLLHERDSQIGMFEVVSSLDEYFDIDFLVKNVFSDDIIEAIIDQIADGFDKAKRDGRINLENSSLPPGLKERLIARFEQRG